MWMHAIRRVLELVVATALLVFIFSRDANSAALSGTVRRGPFSLPFRSKKIGLSATRVVGATSPVHGNLEDFKTTVGDGTCWMWMYSAMVLR